LQAPEEPFLSPCFSAEEHTSGVMFTYQAAVQKMEIGAIRALKLGKAFMDLRLEL
jgi:hypothetical protein